jgi:spermidine synthase
VRYHDEFVSALPAGITTGNSPKRDLFLASFLFLFLELAFIRWFPAQVLFLTFFTNTVLLASFLGLSLGCLATRSQRNYLPWTPVLLIVSMAAGAAMESVRLALQDILEVGNNATSPQMVYFGTEARVGDVASFVIPIELVIGVFFLLIAATMIGAGQLIGRRFAGFSHGVEAYVVNIAGSLAGVLFFTACSWWLSPAWWFAIVAAGLVYFLLQEEKRRRWAIAITIAVPLLLLLPGYFSMGVIRKMFPLEKWSPYYRINYSPDTRTIVVNLLGHQNMVSRKDPSMAYALPYLLNRDAGLREFRDILIIGAGSGNDLSRALQWSPADARIDAVEIDPVIQSLGIRDHPDRPYQDARVTPYLNDGRNFLRSTGKHYDLIIFALIDSLVLHSSVSNLRLESYLFTEEAMADVRRRLNPGGLFVMYNYFRQGWIVSRLAKTEAQVFGSPPIVLTMPPQPKIAADQKAGGFTMLFEGERAAEIGRVFQEKGEYLMDSSGAPSPSSPNGFQHTPDAKAIRFKPAEVEAPPDLRPAQDAWPFLYLRNPMIPALSWRGIAVIGLVSFALLAAFGWRPGRGEVGGLGAVMLLLGAGFMLLEVKAVVHMALIFGSTWIVNTFVFSALLVMILLANLWVLRRPAAPVAPFYAALMATLFLNIVIPLDAFLGLPQLVQGVAAGALVLSPILCAGVIFATLFGKAERPDQALAYNTAGAILGGLAETSSLLIGFQWILAVAAIIYLGSWLAAPRRASRAV